MKSYLFAGLSALFAFVSATQAQEPSPSAAESANAAKAEQIVNGLHPQQGEITLRDGLARLAVPTNFRFLGPDDAETVIVKLWGNPPLGEKPLGMLYPAEFSLLDARSWAVIVSYEESGYVNDADAEKIDYKDMLKKMQQSTSERNAERTKQGYPSLDLVGWAAAPHYDKAAKKLYWAKELRVGGSAEHTLNYDVRILGRRGVLVLTGVAAMDQFPQIESATPTILSMVDFNQGHRYADFDPRTDKVAAYGIAALVAGGVAAKLGLFKVLWIAALGAKKFIIIGFVALSAWIKKLFRPKSQEG